MRKKVIYKTIIRYEILSEEPIPDVVSLSDIAYEVEEGGWSGRFLTSDFNRQLLGKVAVNAVKRQGSDPSFFFMDENGFDEEE